MSFACLSESSLSYWLSINKGFVKSNLIISMLVKIERDKPKINKPRAINHNDPKSHVPKTIPIPPKNKIKFVT